MCPRRSKLDRPATIMTRVDGWPEMEPRRDKIRNRTRPRRILDFLWLLLPTITLVAVAGYLIGALILRANPPVLAIQSQTMNPTIRQGDLAILRNIDTRLLKPGDIIGIKLTGQEQSKYQLPGEIIRRIVKITRSNNTELFITKGDGNPANDPFSVNPSAVSGKVIGSIPFLGFPILFFSSQQGIIFLIASAIILLIYYILGFLEDRRHYAHATAATMQNVLEMVGYVHDAVQETQSISLERLAFPGLEFQKSPRRFQLDTEERIAEPWNRPSEPPSTISNLDLPEVRNKLKDILDQSIQLCQAADWISMGEVDYDSIRELLMQSVLSIQTLLEAIHDPELLAALEQSKLAATPLPLPINGPAPKTFPEIENFQVPQTLKVSRGALLADPETELIDPQATSHHGATPMAVQDVVPGGGSNDEIEAARTQLHHEDTLLEDDNFDIFQSQNGILENTDNVFIQQGVGANEEPLQTPHSATNKRHRRRSMRWRD